MSILWLQFISFTNRISLGAIDDGVIIIIAFESGWVHEHYVLPNRQGEGVGKSLLDNGKVCVPQYPAADPPDEWAFPAVL